MSYYSCCPCTGVKGTYQYFSGNVPQIRTMPDASDYGLPANVDEAIRKENAAITKANSTITFESKLKYIIGFVVFSLIFSSTSKETGLSALFSGVMICLFTYGWIGAAIFLQSEGKGARPNSGRIAKAKERYDRDMKAYDHWNYMDKFDWWDKLDGHEFEYAVATAYASKGYDTKVSPAGGDGGIDIILTKGAERIAVQCKAHKNPVSPSVVRDLYGTMTRQNFPKGIVVSKNGFTSGTVSFASGVPIELVDLNDIIHMIGAESSIYAQSPSDFHVSSSCRQRPASASSAARPRQLSTSDAQKLKREREAFEKEKRAFQAQKENYEKKLVRATASVPKKKNESCSTQDSAGRTVIQMDDASKVIRVYSSISLASRETGVSQKCIRDAANGKQLHAGGFRWKFQSSASVCA